MFQLMSVGYSLGDAHFLVALDTFQWESQLVPGPLIFRTWSEQDLVSCLKLAALNEGKAPTLG